MLRPPTALKPVSHRSLLAYHASYAFNSRNMFCSPHPRTPEKALFRGSRETEGRTPDKRQHLFSVVAPD